MNSTDTIDPRVDEYGKTFECLECGGTGIINACIDDLCHGQDYCIHGDGDIICPVCNGSGEESWKPKK